jgi:hypothetical protein
MYETYNGTVNVVVFAIDRRKKRSMSKTPPTVAVAVTSTRRRSSSRWSASAAWPPCEKPNVNSSSVRRTRRPARTSREAASRSAADDASVAAWK